jgi:hypothetical protein
MSSDAVVVLLDALVHACMESSNAGEGLVKSVRIGTAGKKL